MTGPCNKHISIKYTENLDKLHLHSFFWAKSRPQKIIQGRCTGCFSTPLREGICFILFTRICSHMSLNNSSSHLPSSMQKFWDQNATVEELSQYIIIIYIYIYMSLWQKVLPLNPGMFVYSYLFSSYYSYTKLWLLLFSMHWWVVEVKIGSFGHQAED